MSKSWYPVINYEVCVKCGACVSECSKEVLGLNGTHPVVMKPESCVAGCRECGDICPSAAIEYVGEVPIEGCCCSGCCK